MINKVCPHCSIEKRVEKRVEAFSRLFGTRLRRQSWCNDCHNDKNRKMTALKQRLCDWIKSFLRCTNCEMYFIKELMQFDHIDRKLKKGSVSGIRGFGGFIEELLKTRPLCIPCHALRTKQQRNWRPHRWTLD